MKRYATTLTKDPARDAACGQELRTIRAELRLLPFATVDKQDLQTETAFGARRTVAMQSGGLSFNRPKWRHESHLLNQSAGEKMSALRSLTFTTIPKLVANPTLDRRSNIIARLEEQKLLLNDPKYVRTVRIWAKKDGHLIPVDKPQRVLPWWRVNTDGSYILFVRCGGKPIEFEKGKNGIAVPSLNRIPLVIDILITAVRNGELDAQLAQAKKPTTALKSLKAA
jgi:hypothetical protein